MEEIEEALSACGRRWEDREGRWESSLLEMTSFNHDFRPLLAKVSQILTSYVTPQLVIVQNDAKETQMSPSRCLAGSSSGLKGYQESQASPLHKPHNGAAAPERLVREDNGRPTSSGQK